MWKGKCERKSLSPVPALIDTAVLSIDEHPSRPLGASLHLRTKDLCHFDIHWAKIDLFR